MTGLASVWWGPAYLPAGPGEPIAVWLCTVPGRHAEGEELSGWAPTIGAAGDAARAHLHACSLVAAGLDRLLADVKALPEYQRAWRSDHAGRVSEVVTCVECGATVADEMEHTITHIEAREARDHA